MAQPKVFRAAQTVTEQGYSRSCTNATETNGGLTEHDQWLLNNPEILASVRQGLADSAAGRVSKRMSYAEYANDILED